MSHITTFVNLQNELKVDYLLNKGTLIDGFEVSGHISYVFLLDDFFVRLTSDATGPSQMKVSRGSELLNGFLEGFSIADLY